MKWGPEIQNGKLHFNAKRSQTISLEHDDRSRGPPKDGHWRGGGGGSRSDVGDRGGHYRGRGRNDGYDRYDRGGGFRGGGRGRSDDNYRFEDRGDSYRGRGGSGGGGGKWQGGRGGRRDRGRRRGGGGGGVGRGGGPPSDDRNREPTPRSRLEDDDISMDDGEEGRSNSRL